ncbi:Na-translocating system protein MpsC family protein [Pullulanibacillus sp. KACC 23026]|uniref:Na-translocating system protein MpsC family protein n=1 Tax=Pullulanibacillus sp. KACC 23026 TaxID=3028315 RepID=UPI0023AF4153|nr:Na-translocating system protein MpsC family protein [Pullulanibacillus sp. KACC 23026]WEG12874.1 Na-translocating system protein MpsC family protein [Pullulanibacillus sp. KACC 23026]
MIRNHQFQQQDLLKLSSSVSKIIKRYFGKGPSNCYATFYEARLTIYINKFATPAETVLVQNNKIAIAHSFRMAVMEHVAEEIKDKVDSLFGVRFDSQYSDWDFELDSGIIMMEKCSSKKAFQNVEMPLLANLKKQINQVSALVHKTPTNISVFKVSPKLYGVKCEGVMYQIEKTLYEKGHLDILHQCSIEIKKNYQKHLDSFEKVFGRTIEGLFIIWDYKNEENYIFFSLQ